MRLRAIVRKCLSLGWRLGAVSLLGTGLGCGTTRVSDTARTGTEQLLISNSVDQVITEMDLTGLANKMVFLDAQYLDGVVDKGYVISSLRQHLLASGALLQEDRKTATYIVEVRAGAVGTDRSDLLYGVPQLNMPSVMPGVPAGSVPEIPLAKRTSRTGVAKLAVFVYNRNTGRPVWQSGVVMKNCTAKGTWVFGAGPYEEGTLYQGTKAGDEVVQVPWPADQPNHEQKLRVVPVTHMASFVEPAETPAISQASQKVPAGDPVVQPSPIATTPK